jgi:hypothetical protein
VNPGPRRALDLRGALEAVDGRGHRIAIDCEGERVVVRFDGVACALAAARSARALRVDGLRWLLGAIGHHAPVDPAMLAVELKIGARRVGRAGRGAAPNWLGRAVGAPFAELHAGALVAAVLAPRR